MGLNSISSDHKNDTSYCCRKTAVCNGDQLLDFLYRNSFGANQSLALTHSSAGLAVGDYAAAMGFTTCMLCVQIYCVLCVLNYYLLNFQLRIQDCLILCFGNPCLSSAPEGLATTNY